MACAAYAFVQHMQGLLQVMGLHMAKGQENLAMGGGRQFRGAFSRVIKNYYPRAAVLY